MSTQGIDLGNWVCRLLPQAWYLPSGCMHVPWRINVKTHISQIKCLLGRKFADPELQLELDYVPFRVIEGPDGCPLVHSKCKGEDRAFTPVEILAMLLSSPEYLASEKYSDDSLCIGIPIYFTDQQKKDVLQAAKIAGLPASVCLLDETTAMVLALENDRSREPKGILAFVDIGHASMQVCFAEFKGDQFSAIKRDHQTRRRSINILYEGYGRSLGGREFDNVLFKHFACKIRKEYNIDVSKNSSASVHLSEACESLKNNLSKNNEAYFSIEKFSGSVDVKGSITRKEFETLSISILKKIEVALKRALNESGLNAEKIESIELVGQGYAVPAIIDILTKIFGKKVGKRPLPGMAVMGCALKARQQREQLLTYGLLTERMIDDLETTGVKTPELVSKGEDSEKFLWRRAMHEEGHLLTFLNDFLEKNMHHIGRSEKTEEESYWLSKASYNFDEREMSALQRELLEAQKLIEQLMSERDDARKLPEGVTKQLMSERDDAKKLSEAAEKHIEQLMLERDDGRKLSEVAQKHIEQLMSERDDARKLSEAAEKHIEQLMLERDDGRKLSKVAQKHIEQLMSERDDARKLSEAAEKHIEQLMLERDDGRKLSEVAQKHIEQLMSERDDARKLSEAAEKHIEQLMLERDDGRKLSEVAQKHIEQLMSERDDARKLSEAAQKHIEQLISERDDARKLSEAAQKLIEQLMSERDDARKEVEELRRLTEQQAPGSQCVGYFTVYSHSDLQDATNNFHESFKLGEGGFGTVYKGIIHNTTVAIKILREGSSQGAKEFNQEIEILSKVRHPNLVTLIGACAEARAVIYEYLPNGSLEDRLRCKNNTSPLSWQDRIRIAFEICSALSFLHNSNPNGVVHGDLKPDNILLDLNNVSKISDFGLCRELNWTTSTSVPYHLTDCLKGTLGYMDPDYFSTGKITPQFDVYSFGIMLLRLVTCKEPRGIKNLVEAAQSKGTLKALIDTSAGRWPFKEAHKMISLGLRCSDMTRKNRPDLSTEVWMELKSMAEVASASPSSWVASLFNR